MKKTMYTLVSVVIGAFLYAATLTVFLIPAGLLTGGGGGLALTINHYTNIPVSMASLILNVVMLIVGFVILGKEFAATTLASTFLFPAMLEVCDRLFAGVMLTDDLFLCTLFSGLGIGISMGIVIRTGASTGGMDIPPLVLRKLFRIPMALSMYFFDVCIILSQATFRPAENILYGIVLVLIYTIVLDKVLVMGSSRLEIKVISEHADAIRDAIIKQMDRGVTMLYGEGGYLQDKKEIVMSIISNRELNRLEKLVHSVDPESFLIISSVKEVSGRGFSLGKKYQ